MHKCTPRYVQVLTTFLYSMYTKDIKISTLAQSANLKFQQKLRIDQRSANSGLHTRTTNRTWPARKTWSATFNRTLIYKDYNFLS